MKSQRRGRFRLSGMTLIELLIVLSIVGMLVSLVSPSIQKTFDRASAQGEWLHLQNQLRSVAFKAYSSGRAIEVDFAGAELRISSSENDQKDIIAYRYLFFDPTQTIRFTANGFSSADSLRVSQLGRERIMRLNDSFNENR